MSHVKTDALQALQYLPRTIKVIHTPAAPPAARTILGLANKRNGIVDLRIPDAVTEVAERFKYPRGDVGTTRIEHGIMVGERDLGQQLSINIAVKRSPTA